MAGGPCLTLTMPKEQRRVSPEKLHSQKSGIIQQWASWLLMTNASRNSTMGERQMKFDPEKHHRRSIRLKGYDYSQIGAYFVTICTQNRLSLFGDIVEGRMHLSEPGKMIQIEWQSLAQRFMHIELDEFSVMPNHFHGIIAIIDNYPNLIDPNPVGAPLVGAPPLVGTPPLVGAQKINPANPVGAPFM